MTNARLSQFFTLKVTLEFQTTLKKTKKSAYFVILQSLKVTIQSGLANLIMKKAVFLVSQFRSVRLLTKMDAQMLVKYKVVKSISLQ